MLVDNGAINEAVARHLVRHLQEWLDAPLPVAAEWLPRRNNHMGGRDLLRHDMGAGVDVDFWSKKENIVEEYRLHIFNGKSIRAGVKVHREDFPNPHPWIRSFDAGWRIHYAGFSSTKEMRTLAAAAVKALGLTFGAVDIAKRADGTLMVLEVNRAPGIEGGTVEAYAEKIAAYVRGE
jgi:hypothetical protein